MALERVPSDIRKAGGVARMSDPQMISEIIDSVTIPVMAKARIGHFVEAQVLEALGVAYIDESEVLTPADENKHRSILHYAGCPFQCHVARTKCVVEKARTPQVGLNPKRISKILID